MLLKGAEIARYLAKPDPTRPALLIHGQDAMRVALKRADAVAALTGPDAEAEMRLTRIAGAELRRDGARLMDEIKAVGFFPAPAWCWWTRRRTPPPRPSPRRWTAGRMAMR